MSAMDSLQMQPAEGAILFCRRRLFAYVAPDGDAAPVFPYQHFPLWFFICNRS